MAADIGIDKRTGDWLFSANVDLQRVYGNDVTLQRIHTRLKIARGWVGDSTGTLGSRLRDILHLPRGRALAEARLYVEEALEPMTDIRVLDVDVQEVDENMREIKINIVAEVIDETEFPPVEAVVQEFAVTVPA